MEKALMQLAMWRWQRYSALIALPLVLLHVVLQYFILGMDTATYDTVSSRMRMGVFLGLDILLLLAVAAHASLGLRSIAMDYTRNSSTARRITIAIAVLFGGVIAYGLAALAAFV